MATAVFGEEWIQALVQASANRESTPGLDGIIGFGIGKSIQATVSIVAGRAVGPSDEEPGAVVPFTGAQLVAWNANELNLTEAYTKGDLKATGRTGHLLAALELLDDRSVADALPRLGASPS